MPSRSSAARTTGRRKGLSPRCRWRGGSILRRAWRSWAQWGQKRALSGSAAPQAVFSGRRNPSRDRLLCLCVGLETTLEEAQKLLKLAAYAPLYPRLKRDAIISYGLVHRMSLSEINDKLFLEKEKTLF